MTWAFSVLQEGLSAPLAFLLVLTSGSLMLLGWWSAAQFQDQTDPVESRPAEQSQSSWQKQWAWGDRFGVDPVVAMGGGLGASSPPHHPHLGGHDGASLAPGLPLEQCLTEFPWLRSEVWVWLCWNFWEIYGNKKPLIPTCGS